MSVRDILFGFSPDYFQSLPTIHPSPNPLIGGRNETHKTVFFLSSKLPLNFHPIFIHWHHHLNPPHDDILHSAGDNTQILPLGRGCQGYQLSGMIMLWPYNHPIPHTLSTCAPLFSSASTTISLLPVLYYRRQFTMMTLGRMSPRNTIHTPHSAWVVLPRRHPWRTWSPFGSPVRGCCAMKTLGFNETVGGCSVSVCPIYQQAFHYPSC